MTALFVLVRIVANPLSNVYQKQLTQTAANPVFIIGVVHAGLTLACVPVWLAPGAMVLRRGPELWATMAACAVLAVAGNALLVAAVRSTDLSILGPINAYKSVLGLILGIVLIGELPTMPGVAGVLMMCRMLRPSVGGRTAQVSAFCFCPFPCSVIVVSIFMASRTRPS